MPPGEAGREAERHYRARREAEQHESRLCARCVYEIPCRFYSFYGVLGTSTWFVPCANLPTRRSRWYDGVESNKESKGSPSHKPADSNYARIRTGQQHQNGCAGSWPCSFEAATPPARTQLTWLQGAGIKICLAFRTLL